MKKTGCLIVFSIAFVFGAFSQALDKARIFEGHKGFESEGNAVEIDENGNYYVTGFFEGSKKFDGTTQRVSNGKRDIFVAKYDPNGTLLWAKSYGSVNDDEGVELVEINDNVYVIGYFMGNINFSGSTTITHEGDKDIFILKLDDQGNYQWLETIQGEGEEFGAAITAYQDPDNSKTYIYFDGHIGSSAGGTNQVGFKFSSSPVRTLTSTVKQDVFFACIEDQGATNPGVPSLVYEKLIPGNDEEFATGITMYYPLTSASFIVAGNIGKSSNLSVNFQVNGAYPNENANTNCPAGGCGGYQAFTAFYFDATSATNLYCYEAFCLNDVFPSDFGTNTEVEEIDFFDGQNQESYWMCGYNKTIVNGVTYESPFFSEVYSPKGHNFVHFEELRSADYESRALSIDVVNEVVMVGGQFKGGIDTDYDGTYDEYSNTGYVNGFLWQRRVHGYVPPDPEAIKTLVSATGGSRVNDVGAPRDYGALFSNNTLPMVYTGGYTSELSLNSGNVNLDNALDQGEFDYMISGEDWDSYLFTYQWYATALNSSFGDVELKSITSYEQSGSRFYYALAEFDTRVNLDGAVYESTGGDDGLLIKLDDNFDVQWAIQYKSASDVEMVQVSCDDLGNVYVGGNFYNSATLGDGTTYSPTKDWDIFIDKFSAGGSYGGGSWSSSFTMGDNGDDRLEDLEVWGNGDFVAFAGSYSSAMTVGSTSFPGPSSGTQQMAFFASLRTTNKTFNKRQSFFTGTSSGSHYASIKDLTTVRLGPITNIAMIGVFQGDVDVDGDIHSSPSSWPGGFMVLSSYTHSLNQWLHAANSFDTGDEIAKEGKVAITYNRFGDLFASVDFNGQCDFEGTTLTAATPGYDLALLQLDAYTLWIDDAVKLQLQGGCNDLELNTSGLNTVLSFSYKNTFNPDPNNTSITKTATGYDMLISCYNRDLEYVNSAHSSLMESASDDENLYDLYVVNADEFVIAGGFLDEVDFDGTTTYIGLSNKSWGFIASYDGICPASLANPSVSSLDVCGEVGNNLSAKLDAAVGTPGYYYWFEDDGTGTPKTDPIMEYPYETVYRTVSGGDKYWIQTFTEFGCLASGQQQITMNDIGQSVTISSPSGTTFCNGPGGSATLQLTHTVPSGGFQAGTTLQWQRKEGVGLSAVWVDISGATTTITTAGSTATFPYSTSEAGNFRLKLSDGTCYLAASSRFRYSNNLLIANPYPSVQVSPLTGNCPWTDTYMDLTATNVTGASYSWEYVINNGDPFIDITTVYSGPINVDHFILTDATETIGQGAFFRCKITDANSCVSHTKTVSLSQHSQPTLAMINISGSTGILNNTEVTTNVGADFNASKDIYYNGEIIHTYNGTSIKYRDAIGGGTGPFLIAEAVATGKLPVDRNYPGIYQFSAEPTCAPGELDYSNTSRLTVDCSSLPSGYSTLPSTLTGGTYTGKFKVSGTVTIPAGNTVQFEDFEIYAENGSEIVVKASTTAASGAELILIATATGNGSFITACDRWKGITVEGSTTASRRGSLQITGTSANAVEISGANIAVHSDAGGLIEIEYADFVNNMNDIVMNSYAGITHQSYVKNSSFRSRFYDCSSCTYRYTSFNGISEGNVIYLNDVKGVTFDNNIFSSTDFEFDGTPVSAYLLRMYDADDISFINSTIGGTWNKFMHAQACDGLEFENLVINGSATDGLEFVNSDNLDFDIGTTSSDYTFTSTYGFKFSNCDYVKFESSVVDCDLNNIGNGMEFTNCSNVTIDDNTFGGTQKKMALGLLYNGSSSSNITVTGNYFDLLLSGARFQDVGNLTLNGTNTFEGMQTGLEIYSEGQNIVVDHNYFLQNVNAFMASPYENPLTATSTSGNFGTTSNPKSMDLEIKCNKFHSNTHAIIGSGTMNSSNSIGTSTADAGNTFTQVIASTPPAVSSSASTNSSWDIVWCSDLTQSPLEVYHVAPTCTLTTTFGLVQGYQPNTNTGRPNITLNGITITAATGGYWTFNPVCGTTCYASWKKDPNSIDEFEEMDVDLYPNPTKGLLTIDATEALERIDIYNSIGEVIGTWEVQEMNTINLELGNLSSGVYTAIIQSKSGFTTRNFSITH